MRALLVLAMFVLAASPAWAHGGDGPITPADVLHHWSFDPMVWVPLLAAHAAYGRGVLAAWARAGVGRIIPAWRAAAFLAGEVALVFALISPLDPLGETLLTAHMIQHILLTAIAPPLLVLGAPLTAWMWATPKAWRRALAHPIARAVIATGQRFVRPGTALLLHGATIAVWHAPVLFEAALAIGWVHTLEHVAFFATAVFFWEAAFRANAHPATGAGIILAVFMLSGVLGGLLALAPAPIYVWYGGQAQLWGLSALEDQQLAGLLMWAPGGLAYLAGFAGVASRIWRSSGPSHGIIRANTSSLSTK